MKSQAYMDKNVNVFSEKIVFYCDETMTKFSEKNIMD